MTAAAKEGDTIKNGIFVGEVDLSGMTAQEAAQAVEAYVETLREVESAIVQMGGRPAGAESGPGYGKAPESAPPPSMKTDFRA